MYPAPKNKRSNERTKEKQRQNKEQKKKSLSVKRLMNNTAYFDEFSPSILGFLVVLLAGTNFFSQMSCPLARDFLGHIIVYFYNDLKT